MNPLTYTEKQNLWTWHHRGSGHVFTSPLFLAWELWGDPITDDYVPETTSAVELLHRWAEGLPNENAEAVFGPGAVSIAWFVTGEPFEAAPFQVWRYGDPRSHQEDWTTFYTWPTSVADGSPLNFVRLPVKDKLWRPGAANKGGFFQEATGWKPSALQPAMWPGSILAASGLNGIIDWEPQVSGMQLPDFLLGQSKQH